MEKQLELFPLALNESKITISEALSLLWKYHLDGKPCSRALASKKKIMINFFKDKYIETFNEFDILRYKNMRLKTVKIGTYWHDHTLITLLFNKLAEWKRRGIKTDDIDFSKIQLPSENPTKYMHKTKAPPRQRILTPVEFSKVMEHCGEDLRKALIIAIDTGIRKGDIFGLQKTNYNQATDQIEFIQSKTGYLNKIPVTDRVRRIFENSRDGSIINGVNFRYNFETCRKNSKVNFQFRDLRRTCITAAYKISHDIKACQFLAGHRDPRTTDLYIVATKEWMRPTVNQIEKIYF